MLQQTFIHIQSIGAITENRLWESGIRDWESVSSDLPIPISAGRKHYLINGIEESPAPVNPYGADLGIVDKIKYGSDFWESGRWY